MVSGLVSYLLGRLTAVLLVAEVLPGKSNLGNVPRLVSELPTSVHLLCRQLEEETGPHFLSEM